MEELIEILSRMYPDIDVESCDDFIDGGIMDSFDLVSLVGEIDDVFGVSVPADELLPDNFNSAEAIYSLIKKLEDE